MYMDICTVRLHRETKGLLDKYKEYRNESYDEVVMKLVQIAKNCRKEPELSDEIIKRIDDARRRMKAGEFVTEEEARRRLGF